MGSLWDVYAVACADADIDACPQPMMPVVPVCLYILVRLMKHSHKTYAYFFTTRRNRITVVTNLLFNIY